MKFEEYHPMILFLFFAAVFWSTIAFSHPVFLLISLGASFLYSVYLKKGRALLFNVVQCLLWAVYPFVYASYNHFGVTSVYVNFIGNQITIESFLYGASLAVRGASLVMWLECLYQVFSSDKVGYLLGRVSARLALYFAILLRTVPQVCQKWREVCRAREGIGKKITGGSLGKNLKNTCAVVSVVLAWTLEQFVEKSKSMNSRGYALRGKTAFSIYRFDNRDRTIVLWMFLLFTIVLSGHALEQTRIVFAPQIIFNPISAVTCIFYAGYGLFCLFPMMLERWGFYRLRRALQTTKAFEQNDQPIRQGRQHDA